jgi:3-oxoacyl-[acyl-carrier protein] reductase
MTRPVALVTGGAKNLGRGTCLALARAGHDVALTYATDSTAADALCAELRTAGASALALQLELGPSAAADACVATVTDRFGRVDVVVNNAAVRPRKPLAEITDADWRAVLDVNLNGPFFLSRAAAASMVAQGSGSLIHISGLVAWQGGGGGAAHIATSKMGLLGMSRALADELGPHGVRSNVVVPGRMQTMRVNPAPPGKDADEAAATPLRRIGTVGDVASVCVFLASPEAAFVTGQTLHVNGGIYKG